MASMEKEPPTKLTDEQPPTARSRANSKAMGPGQEAVTDADTIDFNNAKPTDVSSELSKLLGVDTVQEDQHGALFTMELEVSDDTVGGGFNLPASVDSMSVERHKTGSAAAGAEGIVKGGSHRTDMDTSASSTTRYGGNTTPVRRFSRSTPSVDRASFHLTAEPIGPRNFELLCVLGRGAFGKVVQARHRGTGQIYALKITAKEFLHNKSAIDCTIEERDALTRVVHPFLVKLLATFQTKSKVYLVMEYVIGGELFSRLENCAFFVESDARFYAAEVTLAIEYLHSIGIIHRDLKPENVLLDAQGHIRITDFGLAKTSKEVKEIEGSETPCKTICGTDEYMAPEMIKGARYGKSVDWWAFGCLVFEMTTGNAPFKDKNRKKLHEKILNRKPVFPTYLTGTAVAFLKHLLQRNPEQRLGSQQSTMFEVKGVAALKNHQFFHGTNWQKVINKEREAPHVPKVNDDLDTSHFDESFTRSSVLDSPRASFSAIDEDGKRSSPSKLFRGFSWQDPLFIEMHSKRERGMSVASEGAEDTINDHNLPGEEDVVLMSPRGGVAAANIPPKSIKKSNMDSNGELLLKVCSSCHSEVAVTEFSASQQKRGPRRICKACVAAGKVSTPVREQSSAQDLENPENVEPEDVVVESEHLKVPSPPADIPTPSPSSGWGKPAGPAPIVRRTLASMITESPSSRSAAEAPPPPWRREARPGLRANVPVWKPSRLRADVPAWQPKSERMTSPPPSRQVAPSATPPKSTTTPVLEPKTASWAAKATIRPSAEITAPSPMAEKKVAPSAPVVATKAPAWLPKTSSWATKVTSPQPAKKADPSPAAEKVSPSPTATLSAKAPAWAPKTPSWAAKVTVSSSAPEEAIPPHEVVKPVPYPAAEAPVRVLKTSTWAAKVTSPSPVRKAEPSFAENMGTASVTVPIDKKMEDSKRRPKSPGFSSTDFPSLGGNDSAPAKPNRGLAGAWGKKLG